MFVIPAQGLPVVKFLRGLDIHPERALRALLDSLGTGMTVLGLECPDCDKVHLDEGYMAMRPHEIHVCARCRCEFPS